jgi:putative hydrolase of the HAD superfamily
LHHHNQIQEHLMAIRALIFDIGGVLKHLTNPAVQRAWETRLGLAEGQLQAIVYDSSLARVSSLGNATPAAVWNDANRRLRLSAAELAQLQADMPKAYSWDEENLAFIRSLRPRYKTAILSNAWMDARQEMQEQVNGELFDVIVYSSEEGLLKPDAEIYRRTLQRLGVAPDEAIFIDDKQRNVDAAQALGMHGIVYSTSHAVREHITRLLGEM